MANPDRDRSYLGTGWAFPPTFTRGGGEVHMRSGEDDVHEAIYVLLMTQLGERVMREDFGADTNRLLFQELNQGLINRTYQAVSHAIETYEHRVRLVDVDLSDTNVNEGTLAVNVVYEIRATNSRHNMVFDFYLNEGLGLQPPAAAPPSE